MLTLRHMERLWDGQKYQRLLADLISMRVEAIVLTELSEQPCLCAAALGVIRIDELNQSYAPLCGKLIRAIISAQETDGGWGDAMTTALCLSALCLQNGSGEAIDRGMEFLAQLQQPAGIWPKIPMRRMPHDATVSAFVLLQLGDNAQFREAVRYEAAVQWFESHTHQCEPAAQSLWNQARVRGLGLSIRASQLQSIN